MSDKKKTYLKGSAKMLNFKSGSLLKLSFNVEELAKLANEKGWVRLDVNERRETDQYGNTHYVTWDDYKAEEKEEAVERIGSSNKPRSEHRGAPAGPKRPQRGFEGKTSDDEDEAPF